MQLVHTACAAFDKISTDIASRSPSVYKCVTEKNIGFFYFLFNDLHQRQIGHKFVCYFLHCSTLQLANFACLFLCETYVFQNNNFC